MIYEKNQSLIMGSKWQLQARFLQWSNIQTVGLWYEIQYEGQQKTKKKPA